MGGPYPSFNAPNPPTPDKWWYRYANVGAYAVIFAIVVMLAYGLGKLLADGLWAITAGFGSDWWP